MCPLTLKYHTYDFKSGLSFSREISAKLSGNYRRFPYTTFVHIGSQPPLPPHSHTGNLLHLLWDICYKG